MRVFVIRVLLELFRIVGDVSMGSLVLFQSLVL